jgi:hypothetical protein
VPVEHQQSRAAAMGQQIVRSTTQYAVLFMHENEDTLTPSYEPSQYSHLYACSRRSGQGHSFERLRNHSTIKCLNV